MSLNPRKKIEFTVVGQSLQVVTDLEEEYVLKVAQFVDQRIQAVQKSANVGLSQKTLILAAMDIAEEVFALRREMKDLRRRARGDVSEMLSRIEDRIQGLDS